MNEDKIIEMLLKHDADIEYIKEHMATKSDLNDMTDTLDKILKLVQKKDEELTLVTHGMTRHEKQIQQHDKDIARIKPLVGLA